MTSSTTEAPSFAGQRWSPSQFTPPLCEDFRTDGDRLLQVVDLAWSSPDGNDFRLDEWQRALLRHVLERFPDDHPRWPGELRYRTVVISLGRQNGKSVLGAVLGLYALLLQTTGPEVISVASSVEQANIIYRRVKHVVDTNRSLLRRFRTSGTRGIVSKRKDRPGSYVVKAGREESLQGVPISMCLADELHLWSPESWAAIVLGASARKGLVVGITTAGDDKSVLLKSLYEEGRKAVAGEDGHDERMGFFVWEAPAHLAVGDPEALIAANPAIACGRIDVDQEINVVKRMPENQALRYRHNRFVASEASWLPMSLWTGAPKGAVPETRNVVFSVSRAENWSYATITASAKVEGRIYTEVVASLVNPDIDSLEEMCLRLWRKHKPIGMLMEAATLRDLAYRLRDRGVKVEYLTSGQMQNVCAVAYALISEAKVTHADDPVVNLQMPRGVAKNSGDGWRISRPDSSGDIDAVLATVMGIYGAETMKPQGASLYVA